MAEYNPVDYRSPEDLKLNTLQAFTHLLKATLGSGELFMPYAFRRAGWVPAVICCFVIGIVTTYTACLVVTCSQFQCKKSRVPVLDFAETAEFSFKNGPTSFQKYSKAIKHAVNVTICFVQYETVIIYTLFVAGSYQQLLEYWMNLNLDLRLYILMFLPVFMLLSLVPDFTYLYPISILGSISLFIGLGITFYYFLEDMPPLSGMQKFTDLESMSIFSSVFLYALCNFSMLMPLENTMKEPRKFPMVVILAMVVSTLLIGSFGFFGYNKYNNAEASVIKNLPLDDVLSEAVKFTVTTSVLLSYGLQYYIPITILWPVISEKWGDEKYKEAVFRLFGVIICTSVAIAVPQMAPLLSLFGAIGMTTIMLLIPILIETASMWPDATGKLRFYLCIKNFILVVLWASIMCFGVHMSLRDLSETGCKQR